jgi:hypothetical protein
VRGDVEVAREARPWFPHCLCRPRAGASHSARPAGMRTSTDSVWDIRPSPWQVGQAFLRRPLPLQRGQVRLNFMLPAICDTLPVPLHCGQAAEPASLPPVPWQVRALLVAGDFDLRLGAANGLPEGNVQAVFEIGALFRFGSGSPAPPPRKNWLKMSLNPRAAVSAWPALRGLALGSGFRSRLNISEKSKPPKSMLGCARAPPPGGPAPGIRSPNRSRPDRTSGASSVAQDVVGFLNVLEAVFGGFIARIEVRMIFAGELPVRLPDLVLRSVRATLSVS